MSHHRDVSVPQKIDAAAIAEVENTVETKAIYQRISEFIQRILSKFNHSVEPNHGTLWKRKHDHPPWLADGVPGYKEPLITVQPLDTIQFADSSPMENYTIPIEKAVDLTPVSSQPVRALVLDHSLSKVLICVLRTPSPTLNHCGALWVVMESTADRLSPTVSWPPKRPSQATASPTLSTAASWPPPIQSNRLSIVLNEHAMGKASSRGPSTPPRRPG